MLVGLLKCFKFIQQKRPFLFIYCALSQIIEKLSVTKLSVTTSVTKNPTDNIDEKCVCHRCLDI